VDENKNLNYINYQLKKSETMDWNKEAEKVTKWKASNCGTTLFDTNQDKLESHKTSDFKMNDEEIKENVD